MMTESNLLFHDSWAKFCFFLILCEDVNFFQYIKPWNYNFFSDGTDSRYNFSPSPCLSVNWKACTSRRVSSTERPTGRSLMVIWRRLPLSSMMNRPLKKESKTPLCYGIFHKSIWHISRLKKTLSLSFELFINIPIVQSILDFWYQFS